MKYNFDTEPMYPNACHHCKFLGNVLTDNNKYIDLYVCNQPPGATLTGLVKVFAGGYEHRLLYQGREDLKGKGSVYKMMAAYLMF